MALEATKVCELLAALAKEPDPDAAEAAVTQLLNFLLKQLEELRELANGYPRNPISGDAWVAGATLAGVCDHLTDELAKRGLRRHEELASRLAAGMACQVMGHYPEQIFPRVVRNARCREAIGDVAEATGCYESVVADFHELGLSEMLDDAAESIDESGRVILAAVSRPGRHDGFWRSKAPKPARQLILGVRRRRGRRWG